MRFLLIAAVLLLPFMAQPANALKSSNELAQSASGDLSAQAKESAKKPAKKLARKPKEKVEYMRAAPMK